MKTVILSVPDISCEHCERAITGALTPVEGVRGVNVSIPDKQVRVEYEENAVDVGRMIEVLADEDYQVAGVTAS